MKFSQASTLWFLLAFGTIAACGDRDPLPSTELASANPVPTAGDVSAVANTPPVIRTLRFEPLQPAPGEALRIIAEPFDADGDPVTLSYQWIYQGRPMQGDTDLVTFINSKKSDWIEVRVTPHDGKVRGQVARAESRVANRPPSAVSLALQPTHNLYAGSPVVARARSVDFDGDGVTYEYTWTLNGVTQATSGDTFFTDSLKRGDRIRVQVVATDGEAYSPPAASDELEVLNAPPEIVSTPGGLERDGSFVYQLKVKDPDDRRFSYRLNRAPPGMDLDLASGRLYWMPRPDQVGAFAVEVVVEDRHGGRSKQSFELTLQRGSDPSSGSPAARRD